MAAFSQQDINGLFDQADKPMQLAALSRQEMKETEGAWVQWAGMAALGGVMNTATYIGSNSNWTYRGAEWAALSGASGALIGGLPIGGAAARAGLAAVGAYTAGQPWGGYSWARWQFDESLARNRAS
ncbi:MAG: hypothetical protein Q4E06_12875 [Lautropia sp.]|nr:hypothetical protein [Lautropia sp.]